MAFIGKSEEFYSLGTDHWFLVRTNCFMLFLSHWLKKKKNFQKWSKPPSITSQNVLFSYCDESVSKGYISLSVVHDVWTMVCVAKCQRHFHQSLFLQGPLSPWHLSSWWRKERAQQPMKPQSPRFLLPTITLRPSQNQSSLGPWCSTPSRLTPALTFT